MGARGPETSCSRSLQSFSYRGAHRLHPCIIRSLSTLQREGKLEAVHLEGSVMESAAALGLSPFLVPFLLF